MMEQTLEERIEQREKEIRVSVDDYNDTIYAIIGFANLYLLDETYQRRTNIKGFQGRRLTPLLVVPKSDEPTEDHYVTPDLGIVIDDVKGIIGEVKKNFPKTDAERKKDVFVQLKRYDQDLIGWPVSGERVDSHEVVLLVHQTTSAHAREYCIDNMAEDGITFERPVSIVEFNRNDQAQTFVFFKTVHGNPPEISGENKLLYGISVPMKVFVSEYSRMKLYDAQPPTPYLALLIWEHVVNPLASENPKYEHLRTKQKIEVQLIIDEIVQKLDEGFSFRGWHTLYPEHQPRIPHTEWVRQACQFLVEISDAAWFEISNNQQLTVYFQRYEDLYSHFYSSHAGLEEQKSLSPMLPGLEEKQG